MCHPYQKLNLHNARTWSSRKSKNMTLLERNCLILSLMAKEKKIQEMDKVVI
ncbi:hypothetical protein SD1617_2716 [Shigella dysenteriae 1617]|nr:hypothetical protein SD1617_2716 [Shigella dysenteriae 1617]